MEYPTTVHGPLGDVVIIPQNLCDSDGKERDISDIYDDVSRVIEAPAMLIEVLGDPVKRYYYRLIGWEKTLLVKTLPQNGKWNAVDCFENPPSDLLTELLTQGQILHSQK
jgi:hypothetical protein